MGWKTEKGDKMLKFHSTASNREELIRDLNIVVQRLNKENIISTSNAFISTDSENRHISLQSGDGQISKESGYYGILILLPQLVDENAENDDFLEMVLKCLIDDKNKLKLFHPDSKHFFLLRQ